MAFWGRGCHVETHRRTLAAKTGRDFQEKTPRRTGNPDQDCVGKCGIVMVDHQPSATLIQGHTVARSARRSKTAGQWTTAPTIKAGGLSRDCQKALPPIGAASLCMATANCSSIRIIVDAIAGPLTTPSRRSAMLPC